MTLLDIKKKCMEDAVVYLETLPENGIKELREAIKKCFKKPVNRKQSNV